MTQHETILTALNSMERLRAQTRMACNWHLYSKACLDLAQLALELEAIEQKENDTAKPLPNLKPLPPIMSAEELKRRIG